MERYDKIVEFIKSVGFPIAISIWLMYQVNVSIKEISLTLQQISINLISTQKELHEHDQKRRELLYDSRNLTTGEKPSSNSTR